MKPHFILWLFLFAGFLSCRSHISYDRQYAEYSPCDSYFEIILDSPAAQDKRVKALNRETDSLYRAKIEQLKTTSVDEEYEIPFISPLYIPEFPGGLEQLESFIRKNLKYPKAASDSCLQGKVTVRFTIDRDGSVINTTLTEGFHPDCDAEVIRVVRSMPKWKPSPASGKPLTRESVLSVVFRLKEPE